MNKRLIRIIYAGSPLASSFILQKLAAAQKTGSNFEIIAVLTNPPSPQGRHKTLIPTEVAQTAEKLGIPVFSPDHLTSASREEIAPLKADLLVCFDYGRIFGPKFLALFPLGGINIHPSLLPKYRGCTPVPAALLAGDSTIGITVQKIALGTDEGDIFVQESVPLSGTETTKSLMDGDGTSSIVTDKGYDLLRRILDKTVVTEQSIVLPAAKPQAGEASYTSFIKKEDGCINWLETAQQIDRQIRAYTPWPGSYTMCGGMQLRILKAHPSSETITGEENKPGTVLPYDKAIGIRVVCGNGTILVVTELQWQAKKAMYCRDFMNGARNFCGACLMPDQPVEPTGEATSQLE